MRVNSNNEWGKLKSIVVGRADNANWPKNDPIFSTNWITTLFKDLPHPRGPVEPHIIEETNEDLEQLCALLSSAGVEVYRADPTGLDQTVTTPNWSTDQMYLYCPRDTHLVVGNTVIETPMTYRARQFESEYYYDIRKAEIKDNARWLAAPRPRLFLDSMEYNFQTDAYNLAEEEPIFDAANCLRLNNDILYLKSMTGNYLGATWLQNMLGSEYNVHVIDNVYAYAHIDSTFAPIREGLVAVNANRVNDINMPRVFLNWEKIWFDQPIAQPYYKYPYASKWIGMNLLMLDEHTAIVEQSQTPLIRELEMRNIEVWPTPMRHARTLGGGLHCVTLDLERA